MEGNDKITETLQTMPAAFWAIEEIGSKSVCVCHVCGYYLAESTDPMLSIYFV